MFRKNVIYKTEEDQFIVLIDYITTECPLFKNIATNEFCLPKGKIEAVAKDIITFYSSIARLFTPTEQDASNWSIARWKAEMWVLGKNVFEEIDGVVFEQHLDWRIDKEEITKKMKTIAYQKIKECVYFSSGHAKERALEHSPSVIDLTHTEIFQWYKGKADDWRLLRDAQFYAATIKDVIKQANKFIKEELAQEEQELSES